MPFTPKLPLDEKIVLKFTGINNLPQFTMGQSTNKNFRISSNTEYNF